MPVPAACLAPGLDRLRSRSFSCVASFSLQIVPAVGELSIERLAKYQTAAKITVLSVCSLQCTLVLGIPPPIDQCPVAAGAGFGYPWCICSVGSQAMSSSYLYFCWLISILENYMLYCLVTVRWSSMTLVSGGGCRWVCKQLPWCGREIQDLEHCMRDQGYRSK